MTEILCFFLGIFLTVEMLASLYGIVDFWYRISTAWFRVGLNIVFKALLIVIARTFLESDNLVAFDYGCLFFLITHILIFLILKLCFVLFRARINRSLSRSPPIP